MRDVTSDEKENGIGNQQSYELKRKEKKSTRTAYCLQTPKKKSASKRSNRTLSCRPSIKKSNDVKPIHLRHLPLPTATATPQQHSHRKLLRTPRSPSPRPRRPPLRPSTQSPKINTRQAASEHARISRDAASAVMPVTRKKACARSSSSFA